MRRDESVRIDSGPYWGLVSESLHGGERPVHCAHLRLVHGTTDMVGTLFLTSQRVLWRVIDPRHPEGDGMEIQVVDMLAVDQDTKLSIFHGFRLVVEVEGAAEDFFFFPQHRTEVDRILADQMFAEIEGVWQRRRAA